MLSDHYESFVNGFRLVQQKSIATKRYFFFCHAWSNEIIILGKFLGGKSGGVPAADDFVPVMVFVVIKANPPSLLSTVQYVDSFYGNRIVGEDQYWWMQFAAAIEFIKTMLQE